MTTFLYIEDDPLSRQVMQILLTQVLKAERVMIWEDSTDFLDRMRNLPYDPDVVLVDIHMKPASGFDVLSGIRATGVLSGSKIVAVTASVMNEEVEKLRQAGFDGVIGKPVDKHTFPELIDRIVKGEKVWRPT
jgi:two-component system cell cycle response regulator DivK